MSTTATGIEYRPIAGFQGYRVGNDGSIWSQWEYNGRNPRRLGAWRLLKPKADHDGYLALNLFRERRAHRRKVHLLVLEAFVGPRPDGLQGCHNDGDPSNCTVSNLRWDTPKANQSDRRRHGTASVGERNGNARLTAESVALIRSALAAGERQRDIAKRVGVAQSTISAIKLGRLWSAA